MGLKEWVLSGCREGRAFTYRWNHVEGAQYCATFDDSERWNLLKPGSKLSATHSVHAYSVAPKVPPRGMTVPKRLPDPNLPPGSLTAALGSKPPEAPKRPPNPKKVAEVEEARELLAAYAKQRGEALRCYAIAERAHEAYRGAYERNAREVYKCAPGDVDDAFDKFNSRRDKVAGKWKTYLADKRRCEAFGRTFPKEPEAVATMLETMDEMDPKFVTMGEEADEASEALDDAKAKFLNAKKDAQETLDQFNECMKKAKAKEEGSAV